MVDAQKSRSIEITEGYMLSLFDGPLKDIHIGVVDPAVLGSKMADFVMADGKYTIADKARDNSLAAFVLAHVATTLHDILKLEITDKTGPLALLTIMQEENDQISKKLSEELGDLMKQMNESIEDAAEFFTYASRRIRHSGDADTPLGTAILVMNLTFEKYLQFLLQLQSQSSDLADALFDATLDTTHWDEKLVDEKIDRAMADTAAAVEAAAEDLNTDVNLYRNEQITKYKNSYLKAEKWISDFAGAFRKKAIAPEMVKLGFINDVDEWDRINDEFKLRSSNRDDHEKIRTEGPYGETVGKGLTDMIRLSETKK